MERLNWHNGYLIVFIHNRNHVEWPTVLIICSTMPGKGMSASDWRWVLVSSLWIRIETVTLTFFFDQDGPLLINFLQRTTTVNAQRYSQILTTLRQVIKSKRPDKLTCEVILLHDNAIPHTTNVIISLMQKFKLEIFGHSPCSPDFFPCDYTIFSPLKNALKGK